ncbi:STN and carboxypeptidase regulatory-like domain-containing protein [Chitinophaga japonensis]|uniref:STN and carboxypeptidase regulatory-like domain-containing protein n=1 Tax=Chitinophaga japonensis TaxID=104662 RepID=UPI0011A7AF70|nr:STN and carboxypeptidase regulatory-like domain-containing protein [Chitinophaga japonensis]
MIRIIFITVSYLLCSAYYCHAQQLLRKTVTVHAKRQPLVQVLNEIGRQGGFHFSYTSDAVRNDSLVTLAARDKPVRQVLDMLLGPGLRYREVGDHIIIQRTAPDLSRSYTVSGYVKDRETGMTVVNATVYEKQQFISTLTNDQGFFRLRLKSNEKYAAAITVSKDLYRDTTLTVHAGQDQEMAVTIRQAQPVMLAPVEVSVEKTWLGKFILSSKQRMQSLNLSRFFADKPFQYSLVPGLGTHGKLDAQVINKFSVNTVGGYAYGLNGFEIGSVFNIDKKDAKGFQAAGVFNMVGGEVNGVQLAGVHNFALDTVEGFQAAGVFNVVKGSVKGAQMAGVFNMAGDSIRGLQAAGVFNIAEKKVNGAQMAGIFNRADHSVKGFQAAGAGNISSGEVRGLQVAGIFNYAGHLKGTQIGIVNIADTSSGYSIGLLNIVRKGGYYRLAIYANEVTLLNLAFKSGSPRLYGILTGGLHPVYNKRAFTLGYGLGREWPFTEKLSLTTELTSHNLYLGEWDRSALLLRLQPALNYRLGKYCTLFAGPVLSIYSAQGTVPKTGYRQNDPGVIGWSAGISLF